ncbi:hypothetical protein ASPVEDRAFT_46079 [Aspergillus versicolor CBS 583.65]|uniref:BHLH domain-containing protein n=1 Tax=Aspergillus versicolor CBS 583.65 TaxID=1036611 RepID=A0A1L9PYY7_ASPVE|nr:uncharacterized protein ASPVEDRAFT_46079 [Aspergillus versicolor CBS 583.65]OJJ06728.1 hypothetical protein ASPVEDRAFT_46079 [Aspergillus versicolor CBS 583.65]
MSSTPPSAIDLPSPIQTIHPTETQAQLPKRKASSISTSTRYSSSPELPPQQQQARKPRSAANKDDTARGRNAAKRAAHNIIEKRYRTNMNAKFVALEKAMAVKPAGVSKPVTTTASTGVKSSASLKKSEILSNAITYMQELQDANERLRKEILTLNRDRRGYC